MKISPFTWQELEAALRNIGVDLSCGTCAERFFTGGTTGNPHTCSASDTLASDLTIFAEALGVLVGSLPWFRGVAVERGRVCLRVAPGTLPPGEVRIHIEIREQAKSKK